MSRPTAELQNQEETNPTRRGRPGVGTSPPADGRIWNLSPPCLSPPPPGPVSSRAWNLSPSSLPSPPEPVPSLASNPSPPCLRPSPPGPVSSLAKCRTCLDQATRLVIICARDGRGGRGEGGERNVAGNRSQRMKDERTRMRTDENGRT